MTSPGHRAFRTPAELGRWLARHHGTETELVIRLYNVHARAQGIGYKEALDEALCWGWIDGVVRRLDADSYLQRFTPRRATSIWSVVNVRHIARLTAEGRMQAPGLAAFAARRPERTGVYAFENKQASLGPTFTKRFKAARRAWAWFTAQAPSYQRTAAHWVTRAKREETRERRFQHLVTCSRDGVRVPPFRVERAAR